MVGIEKKQAFRIIVKNFQLDMLSSHQISREYALRKIANQKRKPGLVGQLRLIISYQVPKLGTNRLLLASLNSFVA
jgi:hypothetical protein